MKVALELRHASPAVIAALPPEVRAVMLDPLMLPAALLAGSMGWPSSYRDLMDMPYRLYQLTCAVRAASAPSTPTPTNAAA